MGGGENVRERKGKPGAGISAARFVKCEPVNDAARVEEEEAQQNLRRVKGRRRLGKLVLTLE